MLRNLSLCLLAFICLSFLYYTDDEVNESIRMKVENVNFTPITAFGTELKCQKGIAQFYLNRSFENAWPRLMQNELIAVIDLAGAEGLKPEDYHIKQLKANQPKANASADDVAEYELLLTDAYLLYCSHLLSGKVDPKTIDAQWKVLRREGDPVIRLEKAIQEKNIQQSLATALPRHEIYMNLKMALRDYRELKLDDWPLIPEGESIKLGMEDDRIPMIKSRLAFWGDFNGDAIAESVSVPYDENLMLAVIAFQKRHGLDSDGTIGKKTIAALNVSPQARMNQIMVNMERWRWLPQEFGDYYIKVNIANYELEVIKNGQLVHTHKVIAGKPLRSTPIFSSKMDYLVFNPTWTIPPTILTQDVIPGMRKDPNYLKKKNIKIYNASGAEISPSAINWSGSSAKNYTFRQPAGADNALGDVKFMFPNSYSIYLHDTPSRDLFDKSERALSSGCIRVFQPLELAEYLLNDEENWNRKKIDQMVAGRKTTTVMLKEQPNVHLLYWTAWQDATRRMQFRTDIYERDGLVLEALN